MKKEIRFYRTRDGKEPFTEWYQSLKDKKLGAQVKSRLERVTLGNYGDYKALGGGVYELRIHYGAGYRLYFSEENEIIVLFLIGGIKSSQLKDIQKARAYLADFRERIA
jgi:putative addiction module killer protein